MSLENYFQGSFIIIVLSLFDKDVATYSVSIKSSALKHQCESILSFNNKPINLTFFDPKAKWYFLT